MEKDKMISRDNILKLELEVLKALHFNIYAEMISLYSANKPYILAALLYPVNIPPRDIASAIDGDGTSPGMPIIKQIFTHDFCDVCITLFDYPFMTTNKSSNNYKPKLSPERFEYYVISPPLRNKIGYGGHAKVYAAESYAVKVIPSCDHYGVAYSGLKELNILPNLDHPNIVQFIGANHEWCDLHILFSCEESDLYTFNMKYPITDSKNIIKQILLGLEYIHKKNIIHRDIKSKNILITDGIAKIADFGASTYIKNELTPNTTDVCHKAPECLLEHDKYDNTIDIWGVGLLIAEIELNTNLFNEHSLIPALRSIYSVLGYPPKSYYEYPIKPPNLTYTKRVVELPDAAWDMIRYTDRLSATELLKKYYQ